MGEKELGVAKEVLVVFGTRPEAIKMAPVVLALRESPVLHPVVCSTGQHRAMLDKVLPTFGIEPEIDLQLMRPAQEPAELTARVVTAMAGVVRERRPAAMLVHGDTGSSLGAALAGYYEGGVVGHVEAGLRTGDLSRPFPEELNRTLISRLAAVHYAPTEQAAGNLAAEGVERERILVTGNTVVDAVEMVRSAASKAPLAIPETLLAGRRLVLVTTHRRESFGATLDGICRAIARLVEQESDLLVIYPVHLNPAVARSVRRILGRHPKVILLPPLAYLPFLRLMSIATLVLTDSGGIQEEAPSFGTPVLVLREVTERGEGIEAGACSLVGTAPERIVAEARALLADPGGPPSRARAANPYGDGRAAPRIRAHLEELLSRT